MRWRTVGRIAIGWVLTLPASAAVGALAALFVSPLGYLLIGPLGRLTANAASVF